MASDGSIRHFAPATIETWYHTYTKHDFEALLSAGRMQGNQENWFRTMKDQWMSSLDIRKFHSLEELCRNLLTYVQKYNHSPHSSLKVKTPHDRFFSEPKCIRRLMDKEVEDSFLLKIERCVSAGSVMVIYQVKYEVDCRFTKQSIRLRYSPDLTSIFIVEQDGTLTPIRLLNKQENAFIKHEKIHLCRGEEA